MVVNISVLVQTEGELELRTTPHCNPLFLEGLTYARRRGNGRHCIRKDAIRIVNTEIKGWIQGSNFKKLAYLGSKTGGSTWELLPKIFIR